MTRYEMKLFGTEIGCTIKNIVDTFDDKSKNQVESIEAVVSHNDLVYVIMKDSLSSLITRDNFEYTEIKYGDKSFRFFSLTTFVDRCMDHNLEALKVLELVRCTIQYVSRTFREFTDDFFKYYYNQYDLVRHSKSAINECINRYAKTNDKSRENILNFMSETLGVLYSIDRGDRELLSEIKTALDILTLHKDELNLSFINEYYKDSLDDMEKRSYKKLKDSHYKKEFKWRYKVVFLNAFFKLEDN